MRAILIAFILLAAWKVVRTDWIVLCPWHSQDSSPGAPWGDYDETYRPPISPAWSPPRPESSGIAGASSWQDPFLQFASGANFPIGPARLRPDWELIGLKVGLPLILIGSFQILLFLAKRRRRVLNLLRECIAESQRQAVSADRK